jgi:hypothetical protein
MKRILIAVLLAAMSFSAHAERFAVQLGSFADADAAQQWVKKLNDEGIPAYTEQSGKRTLLRAGPFGSREDAQAAIQKVRDAGLMEDSDPPKQSKPSDKNAEYVTSLEAKYGKHLHFDSAESMRAIGEFVLDCHAQDGRTLPLYNALLAGLAQAGGSVDYYVQSAGGETRVVQIPHGQSEGHVMLTIDKWGELQSPFLEPIMNTCFGFMGPVWVNKQS